MAKNKRDRILVISKWLFILFSKIANGLKLIQTFLAVLMIVCINENVCLKTYFKSEKPFINHCMCNKYMCS